MVVGPLNGPAPGGKYVVPLASLSWESRKLAGGKCASLGEIHKAGCKGAPGFCVTSICFEALFPPATLRVYKRWKHDASRPAGGQWGKLTVLHPQEYSRVGWAMPHTARTVTGEITKKGPREKEEAAAKAAGVYNGEDAPPVPEMTCATCGVKPGTPWPFRPDECLT